MLRFLPAVHTITHTGKISKNVWEVVRITTRELTLPEVVLKDFFHEFGSHYCKVLSHLNVLRRRSLICRKQVIDLLCKSMNCFYMIETSFMKQLKSSMLQFLCINDVLFQNLLTSKLQNTSIHCNISLRIKLAFSNSITDHV